MKKLTGSKLRSSDMHIRASALSRKTHHQPTATGTREGSHLVLHLLVEEKSAGLLQRQIRWILLRISYIIYVERKCTLHSLIC